MNHEENDDEQEVPPPCPCILNVHMEAVKEHLFKLCAQHEADQRKYRSTSSSAAAKRGGHQRQGQPEAPDRLFGACEVCLERPTEGSPTSGKAGGSKSAKKGNRAPAVVVVPKKKPGAGGKGKNKAGDEGDDDAAANDAPGSARYVCLTCLTVCCAHHIDKHCYDTCRKEGKKLSEETSNSNASRTGGKRTAGHHCLFLDLAKTCAEANRFEMFCVNCELKCGNGWNADESSGYYDDVEYVQGFQIAASSGYLIDTDMDFSQKVERIGTLLVQTGALPDASAFHRERDHDNRKERKSRRAKEKAERRKLQEEQARLMRSSGIMGLQNMGNTCFFNATMQCLARAAPLLRSLHSVPEDMFPGPLSLALFVFATKLHNLGNGLVMIPRVLFSQVCRINCMLGEYGQQDAQELFSCITNGVEEEFTVTKRGELCPVKAALGGTLRTAFTCHQCGTVSSQSERFMDLSVASAATLDEALVGFFSPATLTGAEAYVCEVCNKEAFEEHRRMVERQKAAELEALKQRLDSERMTSVSQLMKENEIEQAEELSSSSSSSSCSGEDEKEEAENDAENIADVDHSVQDSTKEDVDEVRPTDKTADSATPPLQPSTPEVAAPTSEATTTTTTATGAPQTNETADAPASAPPKQKKCNATMQCSIAECSDVLVIHVKRFRVNMRTMSWEKDSRNVAFPSRIDVSAFLSPKEEGDEGTQQGGSGASRVDETRTPHEDPATKALAALSERFPQMPKKALQAMLDVCSGDVEMAAGMLSDGVMLDPSLLSGAEEQGGGDNGVSGDQQLPPHQYKLHGVVEHSGHCGGGHYVAYVQDKKREQWYCCSDATLRPVSERSVLDAQAYMLYYAR